MQVLRWNGHRWLSLVWRCMLFEVTRDVLAVQFSLVGSHNHFCTVLRWLPWKCKICLCALSFFRYVWLRGNRHVASSWFPVVCGNRRRMFHLFAPLTPNLRHWYGFNFTAISYVLFKYFRKIPVYWYIQIISLLNFHWDRNKLTIDGKCELSRL